MSEHQSRQVDCGSADDGLLAEEAPDLGPLQEAAVAAELAEAMSGLTDTSGGMLPARDPLRPLACAVARELTEAGFTLHHCARHHPPVPARRSASAARRCWARPGEQDRSGRVLDHTRPAVAGLVPLARVPRHSGDHERRARPCAWCAGFPGGAVRLWRGAYRDGGAHDGQPITERSCLSRQEHGSGTGAGFSECFGTVLNPRSRVLMFVPIFLIRARPGVYLGLWFLS